MRKLIFVFLCISNSLFATNYYVKNGGNDSKDGKSDLNAWANISKVNSTAFSPGDSILFKRGSTWSGPTAINVSHSGTLGNQITYGAYGAKTDPKPIFNYLSSVAGWNTSGNWTNTSGNIWTKTVSLSSGDKRLWLSGTEAQRCVNSNVTSTYKWYLQIGGSTLYIYSASNPATAFSDIQYIGANSIIQAQSSGSDYITIQDLDLRGAYYTIDCSGTKGWIIENCNIGQNSNVAISSWGSLTTRRSTDDLIIRNNVMDSFDRFVDTYMFNNTYEGISQRDGAKNWDIYGNTISNWTHGGLALYEATTGYVHTNIKYHDNIITAKDIDYGYAFVYNAKPNLGACYGNKVYNNYIYSCGTVAIQINGDGLEIFNNIIDLVRTNNYQDISVATGMTLQSYSGICSDNKVYNNIFMNCAGYGLGILYYKAETKRNEFVNNIFYNNGLYDIRYEYTGDNGASIGSNTFKNNLCFKSGVADRIFYEKMASGAAQPMTVSEFNAMNGITTGMTSGEVADVITNNISANPLFVDPSNSDFLLRDYHLLPGSAGVGAGINIPDIITDFEGVTYNNPPNIGCFATPIISNNPVYVSSVVGNASPTILEITYNKTLANIIPSVSAFTVRINSVSRTISSVSVSGAKVALTLSSPVVFGDIITVSYSTPASNPLQIPSGEQAASIVDKAVTNSVSPVSPVYVSSVIQNSTPALLEITYDLTLANTIPATTAFTVTVNSVNRTVAAVTISGSVVRLTLSSAVVYGDVVTIAYTKPAVNPLQTSAGGQVATFTAKPVTNNVNPAIPVYVSSVIQNATPTLLEMTYNLTLAGVIPTVTAFSVTVNSAPRTVNSVLITTNKVWLTLTSAVNYGDIVTVSYTKPTLNPLQTIAGGVVLTMTPQSVINGCTAKVNLAPYVQITFPLTNSTFRAPATITINAAASDGDGTIARVEFFNGSYKLGEKTTAPYSFTWRSVTRGTYKLTAVATDNLNSKTTSTPVTVTVLNRFSGRKGETFIGDAYSENGQLVSADSLSGNSELLTLFPNPNDGHFSISFVAPLQYEDYLLSIINLTGATVYKEILPKEAGIRNFDLSYLKSGMYILQISNHGILVTRKFIKK